MALAAGLLRGEGDLPDGYAEVASIEVPSGSFVDTLYNPNQNTRVSMDVTVQGVIEYWFGCWTNDYSQGAFGLGNDGSQGVYFAINNDGGSYSNALANGRHTVEINNWQMLVDGEVWMTKPESSQGDFQLDRSLYLFAQNRSGTAYVPETQGTIICHGCMISEGSVTNRVFVPCVRQSDGVAGLYDTQGMDAGREGKFYALIGSSGLPDLYRRMDTLVVPRGSYIDTGYKPNQKSHVAMDVDVKSPYEYWFSVSDVDYTHGAFALCNDGNLGIYYAVNNDGGKCRDDCVPNGRHTVQITPYSFLVDVNDVWASKQPQGDFQLKNNLYLFASNDAANHNAYIREAQQSITCYGCTIKEGDEVLRQFVPCARTSDGVQGMYDLAGDKFYALVEKLDESVAAFRNRYLQTHDFTSETFVEFNQQQGDELEGFLEAARIAMVYATSDYSVLSLLQGKRTGPIGVNCNGYGYINVRLTLRNHTSDDWTLSKRVVELIKELAYGNGNNSASLVIEANPDYFPDPQTYNGHPVANAFCSLELNGGPIVIITNDRLPLDFEVGGYSDLRSYRFSTSVLYGLTFKGCKNPTSSGGAIQTGIARDKRNAVRVINCTFSNCSAEKGGAYYSPSTKSTEFYCPVQYAMQSDSDPNRFYPFTGSQLTQGDFEGVRGSHLYHCTFDSCTATSDGGAVYGTRDSVGTVVTDCTFKSCKAEKNEGGGIAYVQTAYRCTFNQCTANQGGGCYGAYNVVSCLFRECSSRSGGGAIDRAGDARIHIVSCTLDNCAATDKKGYAIATYNAGSDKVVGCVLVKSSITGKSPDVTGTYSFDTASFFIAPPDDYHIKTDSASLSQLRLTTVPDTEQPTRAWPLYIGGKPGDEWYYSSLYDRDGHPFVLQEPLLIAGCYRGYTVQQWEDEKQRKKSYEWKTMNPLVVTVQEDIVDPKDGKISFREACQYLERHQAAPGRICADQWPRITFALPTGKRWVNLSTVVALDDAKRAESFGTGFSGRQPVIIDGGAAGLEFRNGGTGKDLLELNTAGVVSNVLFNGGTVAVRGNAVPEHGWVKFPVLYTNRLGEAVTRYEARQVTNDRNVLFDNCAFAGGTADGCLASSAWGNVRFVGCSFFGTANGGKVSAAELTVLPQWISRFECCTFSRMSGVNQVLKFRDEGGELRLANCTFAENAVGLADVMIGTTTDSVAGKFRALNCIFADGSDKACTNIVGDTEILCPLAASGRYDPQNKGQPMVNVAADSRQDVFDSDRISSAIRGVVQHAYKPKHSFTARYGYRRYVFADEKPMMQPAVDIFLAPQLGLYTSMGSFYLDDVETKSIDVTTGEDVVDSYDDEISLREAVEYGGVDGGFVQGLALTPTFRGGAAGDVLMTVTGAIHVAAGGIYRDFSLVIRPGEKQTLTISSATNSQDGVFVQDAGTKLLQFQKVTFSNCGTVRGNGGVLNTAGRYRFDDCAFNGCWAVGLTEPDYGQILARVESVRALLGEAGYTDDLGLSQVAQITNATAAVVAAKEAMAAYYAGRGDVGEMQRLVKSALDGIVRAIDDACRALSSASSAILAQAEFRSDDARLKQASDELEALIGELESFSASVEAGRGGAIYASEDADGIVYNVTASDAFASGAGGVVANEGRLVGVNLTFCRNTAGSGAAVACRSGTNLFASVAFVDNVSSTNGALHASAGLCGIVNSIVVGNVDSAGVTSDLTAADGATMNVQYTLSGADVAKADVFDNDGKAILVVTSNGVEQLYYPLNPMGPASGTGAYVFFKAEKNGLDSRQAGWLNDVLYTPDFDTIAPRPQSLSGSTAKYNNSLSYDLLGNLIEGWDRVRQLTLPASMGPVPKMAAVGPSAVVTTTKDDGGAAAGVTTLRAAAEYAMSNDVAVTFADGLFAGGATPVFELSRQIDVPQGAALRIVAGSGRTVELRPSESAMTNKFFTVFKGGSLAATGLTLEGGYARVDSPYMQLQPVNPSDGGAVQGFGPMAFTNCIFRANTAPGHGGAIWSCGGLTLSGCLFETNRAGYYGGAVYSDRERLVVSGTKFVDNVAQKGGGIYVNGSTNVLTDVQIDTADFVRNVAREVGGGLYLGDDEIELDQGFVVIKGTDVRFVGNTVGNEGTSANVFVGERVKFDQQTLNRPPAEYTKVAVINGILSLVIDEEKAKPVLGDFELGPTEFDSATVSVENVVPGLLYGLGRAETPVGPYVVERWVRAKPGEALNLTAPKEGASGFYRIIVRE